MKHILTILFAVVLTVTVSAQEKKKGNSDKAKKVTTEMTEVLSLDEATSAKIYVLQQKKIESIKTATSENKDDKEVLKAKKKGINDDFRAEMTAIIGKDKMKTWSAHVKANKGNKEKKNKKQ